MLTPTVRQWSRRILEAVGLKARRDGRRARRSSFRPSLEALEVRTLPSINPIIGDVFYIDMENHNLTQPTPGNGTFSAPDQLQGNPAAPYLNTLMTPGNPNATQTSYASNYLNVLPNTAANIHPSEPNYIWQEMGNNFGVNFDSDPYKNASQNVFDTASLSGLLQQALGANGWKAYAEDMQFSASGVPLTSASGVTTTPNAYNGSLQYNFAPKHVGQLFNTATNGGTLSGPGPSGPSNPEAQFYAPLSQLLTDLADNSVARYNVISPDQFNDMHTALNISAATPKGFFTDPRSGVTYTGDQAAVAQGDYFLSQIIPQIMASQAYKNNGVIVIWFDETEGGNTSAFTIPEIVISPLARGNAYNSTLQYTHSSDLKSLEELFGVSAPGGGFLGDANTAGTNDLRDMFVPGVFAPSTLGGTVFKNSGQDHQVEAGLIIELTGLNDAHQVVHLTTTTRADGSYSFTGLLPGTYKVTVQGVKKDVGITHITVGVGQTLDDEDFSLLGPDSKK
jgi:hypothetical protein